MKLKNTIRPSVIPRWTTQEIPTIPAVLENTMATSRHAAYWPNCVLKKTYTCVSGAVSNRCRRMNSQVILRATDTRPRVEKMAKMYIALLTATRSESYHANMGGYSQWHLQVHLAGWERKTDGTSLERKKSKPERCPAPMSAILLEEAVGTSHSKKKPKE